MSSADELIRILEGHEGDVEEFVTDDELEDQEVCTQIWFMLVVLKIFHFVFFQLTMYSFF